MKFEIPAGFDVEKVETTDGHVVITLKEKERKLPKSWEEFCKMYPVPFAFRSKYDPFDNRRITTQVNIPSVMADFTEDPEISDALVALIKLINLRNCYNGEYKPIWRGYYQECHKYTIEFNGGEIDASETESLSSSPLYFKSEELRDEFLRNFRDLIEKLKPLYGIKEGGEK